MRRTRATARAELGPAALKRLTNPITLHPHRLIRISQLARGVAFDVMLRRLRPTSGAMDGGSEEAEQQERSWMAERRAAPKRHVGRNSLPSLLQGGPLGRLRMRPAAFRDTSNPRRGSVRRLRGFARRLAR